MILKTLFNIMEARLKNSQEYKSFEMDAVPIKISMTEYHHLINRHIYGT